MKKYREGTGVLFFLLLLGIGLEIVKPEERWGQKIPEVMIDAISEENVRAENEIARIQNMGENKKIALTFDDGPHPIYTQKMLEVLEKEQIPATFFLLGQNVETNGEVVKEIAEKGHLIGNHTYHHVQVTTLPVEQACEEIDRTNQLIEELTGRGTEYVRPPFGTWNQGLEAELDMIPVMWTIDTMDWMTENVDSIVNQVVKNAGENDIILMHDSYKSTVQAVERIIALLRANGFEFVTVDEVIMD
ncbi:MAG: polysaccharide deacetylase family protein [Lachnospiraceae bacterium]|nr:polysaccharide deacetylase family protein [Lachnospiraceae bacterium]